MMNALVVTAELSNGGRFMGRDSSSGDRGTIQAPRWEKSDASRAVHVWCFVEDDDLRGEAIGR
jgi:hypothetical protein